MTCAACGGENPAGKRFCGDCGAPLGSACPSCGAENPPDKRFCGDCGAELGPAPAQPAPRGAPTAERRLVTVLFADLVGFTPLSESRDPEEVRELLSRYFDTTRRLIELYGGTVEKFIGDAVMAVWGTPVATEDDAERAVRASLDLVAAVSALGDEVGAPELRARAGVLTGEAAVTLGARGEGMVAGDLVNTAARIQAAAEPATVLVGEATRRASEATVVFEDVGAHELKGKSEPVPLWRALRVVAGARGTLKSHGLEAPFVGRDRELRLMKELFHASADERKAHLISITGIAGIGKSRIGWEFYKYFDGIARTVWWHRGRCLAYGEGVTYWALADMIRMRCRIAEDEDEAAGTAKVRTTLAEHVLDADERAFIEQPLLQLLGWGGDEQGERQQLFAAWRLFFEQMASTEPVVLVFEDLQWADASLLDFIEYLLEWSRNQPIFVVTLARPELTEKRTTWGAGQRAFTSMYLEPLAPDAMQALLEGLVPGMPPEVVQEILARAEGIPLYAVETVRMLLDRGLVVEDGSSYRVVGEIGRLEVPETLQALIAARLDGLDEAERALVQDAAVLGKTFGSTLLARVAGRPEDQIESLLTSLVRKEVLSLQSDPRSPEHGQYGFLQDIVRRVAYETLARRDRRARHLAAADEIAAALGEEDVPEVVASHLIAAHEAAPDDEDASAIKERACRMYTLAGDRAARLAAAGEAQRFYEQAAALSTDRPARAKLIGRAGGMAWIAGRTPEARDLLQRAREAHDELGDEIAKALIDARIADIDFNDGAIREAVDRMSSAAAAIEDVGAPSDVAAVAAQLGRMLVFTREFDLGATHLEHALELAEKHGLSETLAHALNSKAVMLLYRGRIQESRLLVRGALAVALENDLHDAALRAYNNVIADCWYDVRLHESLQLLDEALEYARRTGERTWEVSFLSAKVGHFELLGNWDDALDSAAAVEPYASTEFHRSLLLPAIPIHLRRGDVALARELLDRHADTGRSDNPEFSASFHAFEALVLAAEARYDDAYAAALAAIATGLETAWWVFVGVIEAALLLPVEPARDLLARVEDASRGKGWQVVEAELGRLRARFPELDPVAELDAAEEKFSEVGAAYHVAAVQAERSVHLAAAGRSEEARQLMDDARDTLERLGAKVDLVARGLERAVA